MGTFPYLEIRYPVAPKFPFPSPDFLTGERTGPGELNWSWHWTGYQVKARK